MAEINGRMKEYDEAKEKGEITYGSSEDGFFKFDGLKEYREKCKQQKLFIARQENPCNKPICCQNPACKNEPLLCILKKELEVKCPVCDKVYAYDRPTL